MSLASSSMADSSSSSLPSIALLGCGFSGLNFLFHYHRSSLRYSHRLFVFESRDYFEYTPAVLRAIVDPSHIEEILVPIDATRARPSASTVLIPHSVTSLDFSSSSSVQLRTADGATHNANYCIIGVGSSYGSSIKPSSSALTLSSRRSELTSLHSSLCQAHQVTIIGSGLVGIEFAAEIAQHFPGLPVEVRTRDPVILATLPRSASDYASGWLLRHGVRISTNSNVPVQEILKAAQPGELIFDCTGNKPSPFLKVDPNYAPAGRSPSSGLFAANEYLQLQQADGSIMQNVFVIGDCVAEPSNSAKMAYTAELQAEAALKNLERLVSRESLLPFPSILSQTPALPTLLVCSLGSKDAILVFNSIVIPGRLAALVKWVIEFSKVASARQWKWAEYFWLFNDSASFVANRCHKWITAGKNSSQDSDKPKQN